VSKESSIPWATTGFTGPYYDRFSLRQSERSRADFRHFQASFEDLITSPHVILDVSRVQRIRDFFGNALYKCSFLADRTNGRAIGTALRLSVVCRL